MRTALSKDAPINSATVNVGAVIRSISPRIQDNDLFDCTSRRVVSVVSDEYRRASDGGGFNDHHIDFWLGILVGICDSYEVNLHDEEVWYDEPLF